ncbi:MAG: GNAT family N-acetyltransferase [Chloroflexaceae bacterium]|nr:GNAT family N-acetyltransferase [Chloroflexaceae bacterium]
MHLSNVTRFCIRKLRHGEYEQMEQWSMSLAHNEAGMWLGGLTIIAEYDRQIIGFLEYFSTHIENLWVAPEWRGKGIGTSLVHTFAELQPIRPLVVANVPVAAVPFFQSIGFARVVLNDVIAPSEHVALHTQEGDMRMNCYSEPMMPQVVPILRPRRAENNHYVYQQLGLSA